MNVVNGNLNPILFDLYSKGYIQTGATTGLFTRYNYLGQMAKGNNGVQEPFEAIVTKSDLTSYLPLAGGKLTGNLIIDRNTNASIFRSYRTASDGTKYHGDFWTSMTGDTILNVYNDTTDTELSQLFFNVEGVYHRHHNINHKLATTADLKYRTISKIISTCEEINEEYYYEYAFTEDNVHFACACNADIAAHSARVLNTVINPYDKKIRVYLNKKVNSVFRLGIFYTWI